MVKVLLINVDSVIPNLALMKVSAYHKSRGDDVGFNNTDNPDIVYASVVFSKNKHAVDGLSFYYPDAKIIVGGSGYDLKSRLPDEIEFMKPDYDLYPSEYSQGYTTRGCVRNCYFCSVPEKEGRFKIHQHPEEFYDPRLSKIRLMDNNILVDEGWFYKISNWIVEHDLTLVDVQFDIRFVSESIAQEILKLRIDGFIHFAYDFDEMDDTINEKIKLLDRIGFKLRDNVEFYVYVHDDSQYESGLRRCRQLKSLGTNAHVMYNPNSKKTKRIRILQRWTNRKWVFWKCDIDDYTRKKG